MIIARMVAGIFLQDIGGHYQLTFLILLHRNEPMIRQLF